MAWEPISVSTLIWGKAVTIAERFFPQAVLGGLKCCHFTEPSNPVRLTHFRPYFGVCRCDLMLLHCPRVCCSNPCVVECSCCTTFSCFVWKVLFYPAKKCEIFGNRVVYVLYKGLRVRKWSTWIPSSLSFWPLGVSPLMHMLTSVLSRCCHFCRVVTILILVFSTMTTILFSSHQLDISCRSLFSFSSISCRFFPQALMVEPSAYMSTLHIVLVLMSMSFINTIKSSGPRIEPCGTPVVISDCSDCLPLNKTNCLRSDSYDENHRIDCCEHQYMANLSSKIKWFIRSKALRRSSRTTPFTSPLSIADAHLCTMWFSAVSHEPHGA